MGKGIFVKTNVLGNHCQVSCFGDRKGLFFRPVVDVANRSCLSKKMDFLVILRGHHGPELVLLFLV
jgi:hypothetical protein